MTVVDNFEELPVVKRFVRLPEKPKEQPVSTLNSLLGGQAAGIFKVADVAGGHRIDLDAVTHEGAPLEQAGVVERTLPEAREQLRGGYTFSDLLGADATRQVPQEALNLVSVSPRALEGVQRYQGGPKQADTWVVEKLWNQEGNTELPFLTRVPFDAGTPGRSGSSTPPSRLPSDLILQEPAPIKPAPRRRGERRRKQEPEEAEADGIVELDEPQGAYDVVDRAGILEDEHLTMKALQLSATESLTRHNLQSSSSSLRRSGGSRKEGQAAASGDDEDQRFSAWSSWAKKPRAVSVFDASVDVSLLSDPSRLDMVGIPDSEMAVSLRQVKPASGTGPVTSFRRPLQAASEESLEFEDPLGAASSGVDVEAIIAKSRAQSAESSRTEAQMSFESRYGEQGELMFPTLQSSSPLVERRRATGAREKPRTGHTLVGPPQRLPNRLRQVRMEDLSDLMRPGALSPPTERGATDPQDPTGADEAGRMNVGAMNARDDRNSAIAMQQMIGKQMRKAAEGKYPPAKTPPKPGSGSNFASTRRPASALDLAVGGRARGW